MCEASINFHLWGEKKKKMKVNFGIKNSFAHRPNKWRRGAWVASLSREVSEAQSPCSVRQLTASGGTPHLSKGLHTLSTLRAKHLHIT